MAELEETFQRLKKAWKKDTAFLSSDTSNHPAYQEIIRMGPDVIPLLLKDMQATYTHWFRALYQLTGENPMDPAHCGNIPIMVEAWVKWGYKKGYLK
jgi:hypothetical protein